VASLLAYGRQRNVTFTTAPSGCADCAGVDVVYVWSENGAFAPLRTILDPGTVLLARNAVNFGVSDGNFQWLKPMVNGLTDASREAPPHAYWGETYLVDTEWGMTNNQGALPDGERNTLMVASVYPGFDDRLVPTTWNGGNDRLIAANTSVGVTYALTWERALQFRPHRYGTAVTLEQPWVQIVTWNDWPEGTAIEPAAGEVEAYVATAEYIRRWHALLDGRSTLANHSTVSGDEVEAGARAAVNAAAAILACRRQIVPATACDLVGATQRFLDGAYVAAQQLASGMDGQTVGNAVLELRGSSPSIEFASAAGRPGCSLTYIDNSLASSCEIVTAAPSPANARRMAASTAVRADEFEALQVEVAELRRKLQELA